MSDAIVIFEGGKDDRVITDSGFRVRKFDEHPAWTNEKIPGEFTIVASKQ